jgi:uncharacterized caspase-like protein
MDTTLASVSKRRLLGLALSLPWTMRAPKAAIAGERKVALVIGNADYRVGALKNPVNDARAVASALKGLDFQVRLQVNASLPDMIETMRQFSKDTEDAAVRVVFYAGHGLQVKGRNYLLPVDTDIGSEDEVSGKSADLNELLDRIGRLKQGVNIVILDACRDDPFNARDLELILRSYHKPMGFRPGQGLAPMQPPPGILVAYSTSPGGVARDDPRDTHSLYTRTLLTHLRSPGLQVELLFKKVRIDVARKTASMQVPWESSNLTVEYCFRQLPGGGCSQ